MYAFTRDGDVRIAVLSTRTGFFLSFFFFFVSICMGIGGRDTHL